MTEIGVAIAIASLHQGHWQAPRYHCLLVII